MCEEGPCLAPAETQFLDEPLGGLSSVFYFTQCGLLPSVLPALPKPTTTPQGLLLGLVDEGNLAHSGHLET